LQLVKLPQWLHKVTQLVSGNHRQQYGGEDIEKWPSG
jgi:hypothetical protein